MTCKTCGRESLGTGMDGFPYCFLHRDWKWDRIIRHNQQVKANKWMHDTSLSVLRDRWAARA